MESLLENVKNLVGSLRLAVWYNADSVALIFLVGDGTVALSIKRRYGSALNQQKKERDFVRIAKAFQSRS